MAPARLCRTWSATCATASSSASRLPCRCSFMRRWACQFLLASGAILWPSWPFFVAGWRALKNGVLNMATLVVLSVGTGYVFSVGATFVWGGAQFYEAVAVLLA